MEFSQVPGGLIAVVSGTAVLGLLLLIAFINKYLYICGPNEILIFSGRNHTTPDGRKVGFRVIFGGRVFRWPIIETIEQMDMTLLSVPMGVQGAYSEGGIPLAVHAVANVKISSNPQLVNNAIERFLGRGREEIARVAKETLEGHLRGVLATMTPEEVNEDRLKFATMLAEEVEPDFEKLGLQLDVLKIQHVTDDRNYLDSIGRKRIAELVRTAEVAESDAVRAAEESEAAARARGEVAQTNARAAIQKKQNSLRQIRAELDAEARSEEERATAAAQAARAQAERELQRIRGELEQLRLAADVTIPAETARAVRELEAAGNAAPILEDGRAMAKSLELIADAWAASGGKAMDMYVLQNLEEIFGKVADAARKLDVREVNLIDSGHGETMPAYLSAYPAAVGSLLREVSKTLGVDITGALTGERTKSNGSPAKPAVPPTTGTATPSTTDEGRVL